MTLDTVIQSLLLLPLWGAAAGGIPGPSYQLVAGARPDTLLVRFTPEGTQPFTLLPARTLSGTAQRALPLPSPVWRAVPESRRVSPSSAAS